jgi:hypothetical protein
MTQKRRVCHVIPATFVTDSLVFVSVGPQIRRQLPGSVLAEQTMHQVLCAFVRSSHLFVDTHHLPSWAGIAAFSFVADLPLLASSPWNYWVSERPIGDQAEESRCETYKVMQSFIWDSWGTWCSG